MTPRGCRLWSLGRLQKRLLSRRAQKLVLKAAGSHEVSSKKVGMAQGLQEGWPAASLSPSLHTPATPLGSQATPMATVETRVLTRQVVMSTQHVSKITVEGPGH